MQTVQSDLHKIINKMPVSSDVKKLLRNDSRRFCEKLCCDSRHSISLHPLPTLIINC